MNAMLKGTFVNIKHKFFRVFGLAKMTLLLAFTVARYNLEAIRSFLAKKGDRASADDQHHPGLSGIWRPSERDRCVCGRSANR